jgi:branched-chain amino acid transport system ATP-binding protein
MPMLEAQGLRASYGKSQVLHGIDLKIDAGQVVSLMGRNGMGKTTTLRALMGLNALDAGRVTFGGVDVTGRSANRIAAGGIGWVPEGRRIFPTLTVAENLMMAERHSRTGHWHLGTVYELFPRLQQRQANLGINLSGGEQQMLAIGRALMSNPKLLLLDEATEGLSPMVRAEIWKCIADLKARGEAILLVDKHLNALRKIADFYYVLERGQVVWSGTAADLEGSLDRVEAFLRVA